MKHIRLLFLGSFVVAAGFLFVRVAFATHNCGSTCNQFTQDGVCTHGCYAGGDPNLDWRDAESDTRYQNTRSVPAKKGTDGGNKAVADQTVKEFERGGNYTVDENVHGVGNDTAREAAVNNPGSVQDIPNVSSGTGGTSNACGDTDDCITFSCTRCSADRRCENGAGENPNFYFGGVSGACNQVDRRPKGSTEGWQAVSLCDQSCSGPGGSGEGLAASGSDEKDKEEEKKKDKDKLACVGLGKNVGQPKLDQEVTFTCEAEFSAADPAYEFRYRVGSGDYTKVNGVRNDNKTKATAKITINKPGGWEVQCRVCTDSSKSRCTEWGKSD